MWKKWLSNILRLSHVLLTAKAQRTEGRLLRENEVGILLKSLMFLVGILIPRASKNEGQVIKML
jgi:hypothetical protein